MDWKKELTQNEIELLVVFSRFTEREQLKIIGRLEDEAERCEAAILTKVFHRLSREHQEELVGYANGLIVCGTGEGVRDKGAKRNA